MPTTRNLSNAGWAISENLGYPLLVLISTPVLVRQLGLDQFGLWSFLISIVAMGTAASTGTSSAVNKLIAEALGRGDMDEVQSVVQGSLAIAIWGGAAVLLLSAAAFASLAGTVFPRMGAHWTVALVGTVACAIAWLEHIDVVFGATLKGAERFGLAARVDLIARCIQVILLIVSAWLSAGLLLLAVVYLAMTTLRLLMKRSAVAGMWPTLIVIPKRTHIPKVLHLAQWGFVQGLGGVLFGAADRLLVGAMLGPTSLTYYAVATQLAAQVHAIAAAGFSILAPSISRKFSHDRSSLELRSLLWKASRLSITSGLAALVILLMTSHAIFGAWIGEEHAKIVATFFPVLLVSYVILCLNIVPFYALSALGEMRSIAVICIIGGTAAVVSAGILIPSLQLLGAAISRSVYSLIALSLYAVLHSVTRPNHRAVS